MSTSPPADDPTVLRPAGVRTARFDAAASCASEVRRFVRTVVDDWELAEVLDDAVLCTAELTTNVVLHTRQPFTVTLRRTGGGIRIDVLDRCPEQLPRPAPALPGLDAAGTTGRGLRIVAALADRWGYSTAEGAKTVWVELAPAGGSGHPDPIVVLGHEPSRSGGTGTGFLLRLRDLPVRTAVASSMQVDDVVREIQLNPELLDPDDRHRFFAALDRSSPARLGGRFAALQASAEGRVRWSTDLSVTVEQLSATADLGAILAGVVARATAPPDPEVIAFRDWLMVEAADQLGGSPPKSCPLPV